MTVEIILVPPPAVEVVWSSCEPLLQDSIDSMQGCYLPEDVKAACQMGMWQPGGMTLLIAAKGEEILAAYTLETANFPRKRLLRVAFAGGKPHTRDEWLGEMVTAIDGVAKQIGALTVLAAGRRGWAKVLDAREVGVVLWRDVPGAEVH